MNTTWDRIQLFHKGDDFYTEAISCIRRAQKSISVEFYIFELDSLSEIFLVELQLAVLRGCEVRLLVDGVGSFFWTESLARRCRQEGITFRVYHPLPGAIHWLARLPEAIFSKAPNMFRRANRRNHRKTIIVDHQLALLGSFNMTRLHSEKLAGDKAWRDSAVRIEGPAVVSLQSAFELAWTFAHRRALVALHGPFIRSHIDVILKWQSLLRLNANDKIRRHLYKDLCRRIRLAQNRVYIATAYFLPKRALAKALASAARRGVDVRILIPGPTDIPLVKWAAYILPFKLQQQGVKIFEYQPTVFHAKYMIIDDWATLGSLNLNHRSLLHDLEVEAVLTSAESLSNLTQQYEKDLRECKPLNSSAQAQTPIWAQWFAKVLFKLRYWF